ncbi:coiled-coil domain-containing protein 113, partial [Biomphalaria glabrata]
METSDSQSVYSEVVEDPLHDLGNDELLKLLEETLRGNEVLITETQMFEKFLQRVDPRDGPLSSISGSITQRSDKTLSRLRSRARSSAMDKSLKLTAEQKCDIAQREIEELRDEINLLKDNSEKVLDTLKAIMEESDMRLSEMKKDSYEFERDIVKGSINYRTHKVVAEKCIRYFEDKLRTR